MKTWMLASIDGVNPNQTAKTLNHCEAVMKDIKRFDRVVLFSYDKPKEKLSGEFIKMPKLDRYGYALWSIRELWRHVTTDMVLTIHPDGYILNPHKWDENFTNYDYIGAPGPKNIIRNKKYRVGNSGFCMRSKKFCELTSNCSVPYALENDDVYFCQMLRGSHIPDEMYAPPEIAARFSLEWDTSFKINEDEAFGFHGTIHTSKKRKLL